MSGRFLLAQVRRATAAAVSFFLPLTGAMAQKEKAVASEMYPDPAVQPEEPHAPALWRPYLAPVVPPIQLGNSNRLRDLIRGGNLYLTAHDAIELALENNIDIAIARYNPMYQAWQVERFEAGGALPGVPSNATAASSVASGQGVLGSQAAAGVSAPSGNGVGRSVGNAAVAQIGPQTQTLDPIVQQASTFSHRSILEPNAVQSGTINLVDNQRIFTANFTQGFLIGGSATISYNEHYLNENASSDVLNPSVAPTLAAQVQVNLLNGFGVAVGSRTIVASKINFRTSDLNFRNQVSGVVADVLSAYYGLVADYEAIRARQSARETSRQFLSESQARLEVGTLAELDVTTAQSQLAASEQDLVNANSALAQDELRLKNLISRTGTGDPLVASAHIVPLDRMVIPDQEDLPPLRTLIEGAMLSRPDLQAEKNAIESAQVSALGTQNGVLPTLVGFAQESHAGLAGTPRLATFNGLVLTADPRFAGGLGNALGQIFRRDFPSESGGGFFSASLKNRTAQADYAVEQLSLRQQQLTAAKDAKQAEVDVTNALVALQQARARYEAAVRNHTLEQQLLDAEEQRFRLGASTPYNVVAQQRDLAVAVSSEISALVSYSNARIALDQATGRTLLENHVSIVEARSGKVAEHAALPVNLPQ